AAERIHADRDAGALDRVHVDHVFEVSDVVTDEVAMVSGRRSDGFFVGKSFHFAIAAAEDRVSAVLDPLGDVGVGGGAVGRGVFEAAVFGRGVRGRNDDPVGDFFGAAVVVDLNVAGDDGRRCEAVVFLDHGEVVVGGDHFQGGALSGAGEGVCIFPDKERAGDVAFRAVVADGLCDGQNMGLGERAIERRAAVAAG